MPPPTDDRSASDPADLEEALVELGGLVLDRPLEDVLARLVVLAARSLPAAGLSVTLLEEGRAVSPASSSAAAAAIDERQAETGEGPCLDAARSRGLVRTDLLAEGTSYPRLREVARRHGVRSVASVGMSTPERVGGALNLYSRAERVADDAVDRARVFASYATVAVVHAHLPRHQDPPVARVHAALRSRVVVEQAKGVLMAQLGTDAAGATTRLEELAERSGATLADVAAGVVDRARRRDRP